MILICSNERYLEQTRVLINPWGRSRRGAGGGEQWGLPPPEKELSKRTSPGTDPRVDQPMGEVQEGEQLGLTPPEKELSKRTSPGTDPRVDQPMGEVQEGEQLGLNPPEKKLSKRT